MFTQGLHLKKKCYDFVQPQVPDVCFKTPPPKKKKMDKAWTYVSEQFKEAHNSFFDLRVYLLKSKFPIEDDKLRFP